jgi:hypothetical protein
LIATSLKPVLCTGSIVWEVEVKAGNGSSVSSKSRVSAAEAEAAEAAAATERACVLSCVGCKQQLVAQDDKTSTLIASSVASAISWYALCVALACMSLITRLLLWVVPEGGGAQEETQQHAGSASSEYSYFILYFNTMF